MRTLRASLPPSYRRRAVRDATRHLLLTLRNRRNVAVYLAQGGEIETAPLIIALLGRGHQVFAPRLRRNGMRFFSMTGNSQLRANRYGILEPIGTPRAQRLDAIVTPLLAFDADGTRLGQGGGHYDRYFEHLRPYARPLRVGFGFALQELPQLPSDRHDRRLHAVATEKGVQWATG